MREFSNSGKGRGKMVNRGSKGRGVVKRESVGKRIRTPDCPAKVAACASVLLLQARFPKQRHFTILTRNYGK